MYFYRLKDYQTKRGVNMDYCLKAMESLSGVAKTYIKVSYLKTALTVFLVGYTAVKAIKVFAK